MSGHVLLAMAVGLLLIATISGQAVEPASVARPRLTRQLARIWQRSSAQHSMVASDQASDQNATSIFVYGTLKSGQPRHAALHGQRFVGPARTQPMYRMVNCGSYPALVQVAADLQGVSVEGEVWSVDQACLARLDNIEGEGFLYKRASVKLLGCEDSVQTYLYLRSIEGLPDCGSRW
eukprot:jgi/Chlat1/4195/Chrsp27S04238